MLSLYIEEQSALHATRKWLRQSDSAIDGGNLIEGAALLQKAVREFLQADCDYWGVPKHRTLIWMAKSLFLSGNATRGSYSILAGIIATCDRVVRCEPTLSEDGDYLSSCVLMMYSFCDGSAYLEGGEV